MRLLLSLAAAAALAAKADVRDVTLGDYTRQARERIEARVRDALKAQDAPPDVVAGTVTLAADECFFLQGERESLKVFLVRGALPAAGDRISAEGRPALEGGRVVFRADSWRRLGAAPLPEPRAVGAADILAAGGQARDVNWMLVTMTGRALGLTETGFAVKLGDLPVTVSSPRLPDFLENCAETHPKVRLRGVIELILDQSALFGNPAGLIGVRLRVASPDDIELEPDAAYLVACRDRRMMALLAAVFALLGILLVAVVAFTVRLARRQVRTNAVMAERKRMADDLHDTIEQHLVGAGMLLQLGRTKETRDVLVRAKREMRDIVWGLKNDDMMRLRPAEMIRQLAHGETRKGICRVNTRLVGLPERLDAAAMRDLSLIVREAIGNAVKHGGAKRIAISSDPRGAGGWVLQVANDGAPFDPAAAPGAAEGHFGLEGMRARARRLHGTVSFSRKGDWTVAELAVGKGAE